MDKEVDIDKSMAKEVDIDKEKQKLEEMTNDKMYPDEQREEMEPDYKDSKTNKKL